MTSIGIIGGGNISDTHARSALQLDGVSISAFFGQNKEKTAHLAQQYGGKAYTDFPSFLKHKPMELVIVGSPSALHAEQGIAAARHGLHVLTEKPLDVTTKRSDDLIAACNQAGVKLGVIFQDRVAPDILRLKEFVDSGRLGKPILISGRVKWYRPPEYYSDSRWRGRLALDGGGALMNQGVHTVDLLLWLMGDVKRVYAKATTSLHSIEAEDTVVATLEFANGALGTLEAATSVYPGYRRRIELTGTEGTVILEQDRIIAADLRTPAPGLVGDTPQNTNASASSPVVSDVTGHKKILEDFLRSTRTNDSPLCTGEEGKRSVQFVQAVYESSRIGQPVVLI